MYTRTVPISPANSLTCATVVCAYRPGYDCPETAAYMDLNVMDSYGQIVSYKGVYG